MRKRNKLIMDIILIVLIAPISILVLWAVTARWPYPRLFPNEFSLRGFEYIFDFNNIKILLNSALISLIVVIITILISIPAAKAIAFYRFRGKKIFELLVMAPIIVPMISIAMGINITFINLGLSGTVLGVVIINILPCIPYATRMIADTYKLVGERLELQARLLGASRFDTFIHITIPLILPGIIGAGSMCFIISFSQYFLTMLIGGGEIITYPMIMFPYIQNGDRTISSLFSLVFLIVSILVLMLVENRIRKFYKISSYNSFLG